MTFNVVTANRLRDGDVVYLTPGGDWSEWLADSEVVETPERERELLESAERAVEELLVVAPYLMPVNKVQGEIRPLSQREIIRARGPSVRLDLGKQAIGR